MTALERYQNFKEEEWQLEYSNLYVCYRNKHSGERITNEEFHREVDFKKDYDKKIKFLHDFRLESLPFGEYPDYVLHEFLNKHFEQNG